MTIQELFVTANSESLSVVEQIEDGLSKFASLADSSCPWVLTVLGGGG